MIIFLSFFVFFITLIANIVDNLRYPVTLIAITIGTTNFNIGVKKR